MRAAIEDAQARHNHVNEQLDHVIRRYGNALKPTLCEESCKPPLKIFEMMYHEFRNLSQVIEVVGPRVTNADEIRIASRVRRALRYSPIYRKPWYSDHSVVGDAFARAALETFYRITCFQVTKTANLEPLLALKIWNPVSARHLLRRMEVDVLILDYNDPVQLEETKSRLACLGDHGVATITLVFRRSGVIIPDFILENAQADAHCAFIETGKAMSAEWWATIHGAVGQPGRSVRKHKKWLLQATVQYILPVISDVVQSGSTVKLKIGWSRCEYSLEKNKLRHQ